MQEHPWQILWRKYHPWLATAIAVLGGLFFLQQALIQAHAQASVLDEGAYLYKGYLFASGQYKPFEPYGPWTNHMPLSFLIPGSLQLYFGLGIRTARYAAIVIASIGLLTFWMLARRLAGCWWAAGLVWAVVYNPALVKLYSVSTSQGLVFCLLVIALYLVLGERLPAWQLVLGAVVAGLLLMTRINMAPVYFLLLFYIFWQHGRKAGWWATGISLALVLGGHLYYSPGIFEFWGKQLPAFITIGITSLLHIQPPVNPGEIAMKVWNPEQYTGINSRWQSLLLALKVHLAPMLAFTVALLVWRFPGKWKNRPGFKQAAFLTALFTSLFAAHAWAALGKSYCVFCLESYLAFFSPLGLLLIAVVLSQLPEKYHLPLWRSIVLTVFLMALIVWYGNQQAFITVRDLLRSDVPRYKDFHRQSGTIPFWGLIENLIGWDYETSFTDLSWGYGGVLAIGVTLVNGLIQRFIQPVRKFPWAVTFLVITLALAAFAAPSEYLSGYDRIYDCRGDVIESYEAVGTILQQVIPPGSKLYWRGGLSAVPLLYIPDSSPYLPQINSNYSRFIGGDPDTMLMLGRWNDALEKQWLREADFLLVASENLVELQPVLDNGDYQLVATTPVVVDCRLNGPIYVYQRVK